MGKPAARLGDTTSHGSPLLGAPCPTVLIGGKPAWRIGDQHTCPIPNAPPPACSGTPHGPGVTTPVPDGGSGICLIGGKPAARVGDIVMEPGALIPLPPPNNIAVGEFTVLIGMAGGGGSPDVCQTEGHPVDVVTGRVIEWVTDFERLSPAPLVFKRFYDSNQNNAGVFGRGWRHCYEFTLQEKASELELIDDVGCVHRFPKPEFGETLFHGPVRIEARGDREFVVWLQPDKGLHFTANKRGSLVLTTMYDPNGLTRRLSHDEVSRLIQVRDHCGRVLEIQYADGRIAAVLERSCENASRSRVVAEYRYRSDGSLATVLDASGLPLSYKYAGGYLVQETDRSGFSFYFEYDRQGRCVCTWGDGGILYRSLDYDVDNGITRVIDSHGVSRFYEHPNGAVTRLVHADGAFKTWAYNEKGLLIGEEDETGVAFCYEYDDDDRLAKMITPGGGWIQYSYDEIGRMVSCVTSEAYVENWSFDAAGRILTVEQGDDRSECQYDTQGNLTRVLRAGHITEYTYDAHNRMVKLSSAENQWIRLTYDEFSNVRQLSDSLGTITTRTFDPLDRLVAITDPDGRKTEYGWNACGFLEFSRERDGTERNSVYLWQLVTEERVVGSGVDSRTGYEFDTELRLTAIRLPGSGRIEYVWNDRGHLIERLETSGEVVQFLHDAAGRVTEEKNSAFCVRFEHDGAGNLAAVHGPDNSSIEYGYDGFGRTVLGVCGDHVSELLYNSAGRLVKESCGGRSIEYSYGPAQQRVGLKPSNGIAVSFDIAPTGALKGLKAAGQSIAEFCLDARGRVVSVQFGNGLLERRVLDAMGQMRTQDVVATGKRALHKEYEYDVALRLIERRRNGDRHRFTYTGIGWVDSETSAGHADARSVAYDDHGNVREIFRGRTARYDQGDRLLFDGQCSYEYDSVGRVSARVTSTGERTAFHYDFRDLLIQVDHFDGGTTKYEYDAFGRRVLKVENGQSTGYLWDGDQLLATWDVACPSTVTQFVMDPFRWIPLAQLNLSFGGTSTQIQSLYCHTDHIGSVTELTSSDGAVVWSAEYDAFGAARTMHGDAELTILRRPGQYFDSETGLYYNRYRYYDPSNGRFTTPDPAHVSGGLNLYRYPGSTLTTLDLLGLSGLIALVDNNFLASLENSVRTGQDSWLVKYAQKNKGRLGVSPTAHNEFTNPQGFGPSELKARRDLLRRFQIDMHVPCSGTAQADYANALARYQAGGLGAPSQAADARIAAHARASNLPLISADQRAFVTNQQFFQNSVGSVQQLGSARGGPVFMLSLL